MNFYRVALDIPTRLGERAIAVARSPFSLMTGDLVKISGRLGVVLGISEVPSGQVVEEVVVRGYLPPRITSLFEELALRYALPFFGLVRLALGSDLGFERVLMSLVFHGKYEGRSLYLGKIYEILRDRGILTYGELLSLVEGDRAKANRYWNETQRRGWAETTIVARMYMPVSESGKTGGVWLRDARSGRMLPLWTWNKMLGRKEVYRLLKEGILVPAQVIGVGETEDEEERFGISHITGFASQLIDILTSSSSRGISIVVAKSDTTALWLARLLAQKGIPVVWRPGMGDRRMLSDMLAARVPGVYVGSPAMLVAPWISADRIFAFDIDDAFLVIPHASRYYELHAFSLVRTFAQVFGIPLVWISPLPLLAVYVEGVDAGHVHPNAQVVYRWVPKDGVLAQETVEDIGAQIESGGRVLVLVGRTGYKTVRLCETCGYVQRCPVCGGVMVYHAKEDVMVCHRCGTRQPPLLICPCCGGIDFKMLGVGVELVEAELVRLFGENSVVVVTGGRQMHLRRISKVPIVVATQALFSGRYPYYNFDLSVLVSIDHLWALGKFDVLEKAVRFVRRLAYLSDRVVVQTVMPDEWRGLIDSPVSEFLKEEARMRQVGGTKFPPFSRLFRLRWTPGGGRVSPAAVERALKRDKVLSVFRPEHERYMGEHVVYVDVLSPRDYISPVILALAGERGFVGLRILY